MEMNTTELSGDKKDKEIKTPITLGLRGRKGPQTSQRQ